MDCEYAFAEDSGGGGGGDVGGFLVSDGNDELSNGDQYGEVVYANSSQTILLHNGEYYIQADGDAVLLGNDPVEPDEGLETESSLLEQSADDNVIRYLGDDQPIVYKFVQNETSFDSAEETTTEPPVKKIKLESGQSVEPDESESVSFDVQKHLKILEEQEGLMGSRFQYAVIKDGKLHLQLDDTDSIEILKSLATENDDSSQAVTPEPELDSTADVVDLSKVTGRNLITGQTVTLDDYLERIHNKITGAYETELRCAPNRVFLNKKFTIGKTTAGKTLVGKILQIKTGQEVVDESGRTEELDEPVASAWTLEENADDLVGEMFDADPVEASSPTTEPVEEEPSNVQELIFDSTGKILSVGDAHELRFNEGATDEHLEFLSKMFSGLADMDSVRRKVLDRELRIKFVEKSYESKTQNFRKVVTHLKGRLVVREPEDGYAFVLNDDDLETKLEEQTSLSVVICQDRTGHKTTRVNLCEQSDNSTTVCKMCGREFRSIGHLNRHVSTSHSDKPLMCHICQIKFGHHGLLNKHRRHHEHYFVCTTCGKNFTTQSSLRRHLSVHDHSLRPLECTICNARFTDESSLCKHLIIHTGIRAYQCDVCQKSFTTVGDLNFHRRVHAPVKLFYCKVCGREFSRHSNLLRHTEIHKGAGELYKCSVCSCSYKFISSLTRHVVQNHMGAS